MNTATVYIKGGTVEVPIDEIGDYLYENADKLEPRHHPVRRRRLIDEAVTSAVEK